METKARSLPQMLRLQTSIVTGGRNGPFPIHRADITLAAVICHQKFDNRFVYVVHTDSHFIFIICSRGITSSFSPLFFSGVFCFLLFVALCASHKRTINCESRMLSPQHCLIPNCVIRWKVSAQTAEIKKKIKRISVIEAPQRILLILADFE